MEPLKGRNEEDCRGERCSAGEENTCENKEEQQDANSIEEQAETDDAIAENAKDAFQSQVPQEKTMIMLVCLCMMLASIRKNLSISKCYKADSEGSSIHPGAKRNSLCLPWMILSKQTFLSVVFPMTVTLSLHGESKSDEIWPMRSQRLREESFNNPQARRELRGKSPIILAENGFYWDAYNETIQCFYCRCRPTFGHVDCHRKRCNVTPQMGFWPMLRAEDQLRMMGVAEHVPGPVLPQGRRASRCGPSNHDTTGTTSCSSQTDRLESPRLHMHAESREHHGAIADSGLYNVTASGRAFTSVNGMSDENNRRTSVVVRNASSSPRPGGGSHSDNAVVRAEPRLLFHQVSLDLGGVVYPMYQDIASRRDTFSHWDESQAPLCDDVILCGMFYAGYLDCVRCFCCGVGLKHWMATDDVWTQHVRWRPECPYLRAVKGDDFIRDTQRRLGIQSYRDQSDNSGRSMSDVPPGSRNDSSAPPASTQGLEPTTTLTTASITTVASMCTTTAATITSFLPILQASPASSTAAATANTSQQPGATASLSGATAATRTLSPSASPSGCNDDQAEVQGDNAGRARVTVAVSSVTKDRKRLARLEADIRTLSRRLARQLRCRVCHKAAIDTILLPCGHLVVCETCAKSMTSCPLCHDTIRGKARVNIE